MPLLVKVSGYRKLECRLGWFDARNVLAAEMVALMTA